MFGLKGDINALLTKDSRLDITTCEIQFSRFNRGIRIGSIQNTPRITTS